MRLFRWALLFALTTEERSARRVQSADWCESRLKRTSYTPQHGICSFLRAGSIPRAPFSEEELCGKLSVSEARVRSVEGSKYCGELIVIVLSTRSSFEDFWRGSR
jgi:hypothetical protein